MTVTTADLSVLIAPVEAARILELSVQHVKRLADSGSLNAVRTDLGRLFDRDEVERFAAEREFAKAAA